jgi:hypothetical protein
MPVGSLKKRPRPDPLYDADFYRWTQEQGRALRAQHGSEVDWENVAEEIEALGRSDRRSIESNLNVILLHLLKWQYQPDQRKPGWRSSIAEHRARIRKLTDESPSLREYPAQVLEEEYQLARMKAVAETELPEERFPQSCPFRIAEVLDFGFLPDASDPASKSSS